MVTSAFSGSACGEQGPGELPRTPWSIRISGENSARPAMEVYAGEILLDVVVATPLSPGLLCGARRTVWGGRAQAIAWGRLIGSWSGITVRFSRGWLGRGGHAAEVIPVSEWFWLAVADGRFGAVTVSYLGNTERRRVVPVRVA